MASRSAFTALRNGEEIPIYDVNTSDEEEDEVPTPNQMESPSRSGSVSTFTPTTISYEGFAKPQQESRYVSSNFTATQDNLVFGDDYVIFGLKSYQNLLIRGQFVLEIQRGAITINKVIYHSGSQPFVFLNPASNSLPLIEATQVTDISKVEDKLNEENEHLFSSSYKSVIKVINLKTGLGNLGKLFPPLKNVFWKFDNIPLEDLKNLDDFETRFRDYTFFPILKPDNSITILKYNTSWLDQILKLTELYKSHQLLKILVIGGKNSGKSTLLKLILQHFQSSTDIDYQPIDYLDLDPGQAEFSKPDSISLSKISSNQFGNHLSLSSPSWQVNHYVGFTSPKDQPKRYNDLVSDLIARYNNDGAVKNESLLVNTPGWIKGYGLDLTNLLIEQLKPTHLIYLNSGNMELDELKIDSSVEIIPMLGNYQNYTTNSSFKYSSSQVRNLKKISYFHKHSNLKFDFKPLCLTSPLQCSYGENGIKAVSFWNEFDIDDEFIKDSLEGTIVALHTIPRKVLSTLNVRNTSKIPMISSKTSDISPNQLKFKALALVHSIDETQKLFNLYIPQFENLSPEENHDYILIRAKTETPICELSSNEVLNEFGKKELPFITFDKAAKFHKVWKIRKNVQRRGQVQ